MFITEVEFGRKTAIDMLASCQADCCPSNHTQPNIKMSPQELARLLEVKASARQSLTEEEYATLCDMCFAHERHGLYLDTDAEVMESIKKYPLVAEIFERHEDAEEKIKSGEVEKVLDGILKNALEAPGEQVR